MSAPAPTVEAWAIIDHPQRHMVLTAYDNRRSAQFYVAGSESKRFAEAEELGWCMIRIRIVPVEDRDG